MFHDGQCHEVRPKPFGAGRRHYDKCVHYPGCWSGNKCKCAHSKAEHWAWNCCKFVFSHRSMLGKECNAQLIPFACGPRVLVTQARQTVMKPSVVCVHIIVLVAVFNML